MICTMLELPYPPSINHYYGRAGNRVYMKPAGVTFREHVMWLIKQKNLQAVDGRLCVVMVVCPPDRRARDLDNVTKAVLDSLQHAGVYKNDSQIDELTVRRGSIVEGGRCEVMIGVLDAEQKQKATRSKRASAH